MLIVFDSGTSVFKSFGGRLISSALGVRKTVVTMKKMSSRNATSTIGVMSMRMPTRRFGRRPESPPFFLPDFLSRSEDGRDHEEDEQQERDVDHRRHVDANAHPALRATAGEPALLLAGFSFEIGRRS